jgi:hypothetical protein
MHHEGIIDELLPLLRPELVERVRPLRGLFIHGVEVTQGIQYYRAAEHLTDAADRAPDNAVTLIAGKPAWVRVYLRAGFAMGEIPGITGTLELIRRDHGLFYFRPGTLFNPQPPGSATARQNPSYATERGTLTDSLNFIIPAEFMCGHLRLIIRVTSPAGTTAETTVDLNVTLRQTLRLAGIMVGYNGPTSTAPGAPNVTIAAPTLANLQTTSAWTLVTFPVQNAATYRTAGTITWNRPLTDAPSCPGCCTPNWVALNAAVQAVRIADGNRTDVLYYGLMGVGIPMGAVIGCNSSGVSTGANGNGVTMAHELGHACGLPHAPCGTPGDPNYPAYEPYDPAGTPRASIGEYGLDISNGNIFSPALFKDMMSYCPPRWISLYNYGRLTNNPNLAPVRTCVDYPWWRDIVLREQVLIPERWLPDPPPEPWRTVVNPEPVISIIGVMHSETKVEIKSVMRLEVVSREQTGTPTDLTAELVDKQGQGVAHAPLYRLQSHACMCEHSESEQPAFPYLFQAFVSDVQPGARLRIQRGEKEIWSRSAPAAQPQVEQFTARLQKGDQIKCEWHVQAAEGKDVECWLQWSKDRGQSWSALSTDLREGKATVDSTAVASGRIVLRLLASDGFHTAKSRNVALTIPKRAPAISILAPGADETLVAGNPIRLYGAATNDNDAPVADKDATWSIDGKIVGRGLDIFVAAPAAGTHELTLSVKDGSKKGEHSIKFKTIRLPSGRTAKAD